MSAAALALTWTAGLLVGLLLTTVFLLRRQVRALQLRLLDIAAVTEQQDARIFMLEQEQRWLAAKVKQTEFQS